MISMFDFNESNFATWTPALRDDVVIRRYGNEALVWSPIGVPLRLDPVGGVILQLLDGETSVLELADDIVDVIGVPRAIAVQQLKTIIGSLDSTGALTTSSPVPSLLASGDLFYGPLNP